jgi:hypothetical protein
MYEVRDLAGDAVETGFGDKLFDSPLDAVADAMVLGRAAVQRLQQETLAPKL